MAILVPENKEGRGYLAKSYTSASWPTSRPIHLLVQQPCTVRQCIARCSRRCPRAPSCITNSLSNAYETPRFPTPFEILLLDWKSRAATRLCRRVRGQALHACLRGHMMRLPSKALRLGGIVIIAAGLVIGSAACDGGAVTDPPTSTAAMSAAKSGPDETASTVDSARVNPTAAVEPTTVSATVPETPAPTAARAVPVSTTVPEVAKPTPSPTEIPLPYVETEDGSVLIMYEVPTSEEDMLLDLKAADHMSTELSKLYGRRPYGQLILKVNLLVRRDGSSVRKVTTVPQVSIPFTLPRLSGEPPKGDCGLALHEMAHYFTAILLRTKLLWFNEGLSDLSTAAFPGEGICVMNLERLDFDEEVARHGARHPGHTASILPSGYELLKAGTNIFRITDCETSRVVNGTSLPPSWRCIKLLSAHSAGMLFFYALAVDYGIDGPVVGEFVKELVRLAKDGRHIGTEDLRTAAMEVSGNDIGPLLDLLEPAIVFNGYYQDDKGIEFIKSHPEYSTEDTSWID